MKSKMKGIGIRDILCSIVVFLVVWGISACICYRLMRYCADYYDMDYSDFTYEELTYVGYEKKRRTRSSPSSYNIYFKEYDVPFNVDGISKKRLDVDALKELGKKEIVKVYYYIDRYSKYRISEISSDDGVLLSLPDFLEVQKENKMVGSMFILILGTLSGSILAGSYLKSCNSKEKEAADQEPMAE